MTEERITRTTDEDGNTHTTHTVVSDGARESGGGMGKILLLLVAIVAIVAAVMIFSNMSNAEVAKDNAIGDAAGEVGEAAGQVGDAAQDAAEQLDPSGE